MVDKECLKQLTDNLKHPGVQINVGGAMVATPAFKFFAKLQMILKSASIFVRFYKTTGISISKTMIQWDPNIN